MQNLGICFDLQAQYEKAKQAALEAEKEEEEENLTNVYFSVYVIWVIFR